MSLNSDSYKRHHSLKVVTKLKIPTLKVVTNTIPPPTYNIPKFSISATLYTGVLNKFTLLF